MRRGNYISKGPLRRPENTTRDSNETNAAGRKSPKHRRKTETERIPGVAAGKRLDREAGLAHESGFDHEPGWDREPRFDREPGFDHEPGVDKRRPFFEWNTALR